MGRRVRLLSMEYRGQQRQFGVLSARNSAKNSAKFALELSIRPSAECSCDTTASGNLVVDRTDAGIDHRTTFIDLGFAPGIGRTRPSKT